MLERYEKHDGSIRSFCKQEGTGEVSFLPVAQEIASRSECWPGLLAGRMISLDKNLKRKSHQGYIWVYYSPEGQLVFFSIARAVSILVPRKC